MISIKVITLVPQQQLKHRQLQRKSPKPKVDQSVKLRKVFKKILARLRSPPIRERQAKKSLGNRSQQQVQQVIQNQADKVQNWFQNIVSQIQNRVN